YKMDIPLAELNKLAKLSTTPIELGSYCTVFTATEILSKIREGIRKEDIICGVYRSVVKRIIEMDPLAGDVVLTGGVIAYNDIIKELLAKTLNKEILVPAEPQYTGALGAALYGATDYTD
ncbi:MAG: ATPase, partial [Planctomycetes bacterium]|nr:ATPase [Planctomycetota bacterium]